MKREGGMEEMEERVEGEGVGGGDNRRVEEVKVEGRGGGVARDDMC